MKKLSAKNWSIVFKIGCEKWNQIQTNIQRTGIYTDPDLKYCLFFMYLTDYSLISNEGIFKNKPPYVLKWLWDSNLQSLIDFINNITEWERQKAKTREGVLEPELMHVLYLKKIVDWVYRNKYQGTRAEKKKIIGGEYNRKRVY